MSPAKRFTLAIAIAVVAAGAAFATSYAARVDYTTGTGPQGIALGSLRGNGILDAVTGNNGAGTVSVLLGVGDGTFAAKTVPDLTSAGTPLQVALVDLNGDGKLDLFATQQTTGVSVWLGVGDGTFGTRADYSGSINNSNACCFGDFRHSGHIDALAAGVSDNHVGWWTNDGTGVFTYGATIGVGSAPVGLVAADFDGDGWLDFAVTNFSDPSVEVFLNSQSGSFGLTATLTPSAGPAGIVAGCLRTGNPKVDLVVACQSTDFVSVFLGNGDGTFAAKVDYSAGTGTAPMGVSLIDTRNCGILDIVTSNHGASTVSVLLGVGDGTFGAPTQLTVVGAQSGRQTVAQGDLNQDGKPDIVVACSGSDKFSVLLQTTSDVRGEVNTLAWPRTLSGEFVGSSSTKGSN